MTRRTGRFCMLLMGVLLFAADGSAQSLYRYYNFQYFFPYANPTTRVSAIFGEVDVLRNGTSIVDQVSLDYFEPNQLLCCADLAGLTDSSVTDVFVAYENDIISFYGEAELSSNAEFADITVTDSLLFEFRLVDSSGAVQAIIDTIGVVPFDTLNLVEPGFISNDTTVLHSYAIPASLNGVRLRLQVHPLFFGSDTLDFICRRDIESRESIAVQRVIEHMVAEDLINALPQDSAALDSMFQKMVRHYIESAAGALPRSIVLNVSPNPVSVRATIKLISSEPTVNAVLYVFSMQGRLMEKRDVSGASDIVLDVSQYPVGSYYLVPFDNEVFQVGVVLHVIR